MVHFVWFQLGPLFDFGGSQVVRNTISVQDLILKVKKLLALSFKTVFSLDGYSMWSGFIKVCFISPSGRGRRKTTNVKLVDISEIVNRIAPKVCYPCSDSALRMHTVLFIRPITKSALLLTSDLFFLSQLCDATHNYRSTFRKFLDAFMCSRPCCNRKQEMHCISVI